MNHLHDSGMMKRTQLFLIVLIPLILFGCDSQYGIMNLYEEAGSDATMLIIRQGALFGFADAGGNVVIKPQFTAAWPFHEGLAAVRQKDKCGYIDKTGKIVIPFQYVSAGSFHNGSAIVATEEKVGEEILDNEILYLNCSIIDMQGNVLRALGFLQQYAFFDDILLIKHSASDDWHLLDSEYKEVASVGSNVEVFSYSEGLALANDKANRCYYYVDKFGKQAFDGRYQFAESFSCGRAAVMTDTGKWGYIDNTGAMVIPGKFDYVNPFGEGLACVSMPGHGWVIIDNSGKEMCMIDSIKDMFPSGYFSDGRCVVDFMENMRHRYGYIDTNGKLIIDGIFDDAAPFVNGIAQVLVDGKIGYIDKSGKYIWEPK
jgi:hypothetical protein